MKIFYVLGFMPPYITREIEAMAKAGHSITVLLPEVKSKDLTANFWNDISKDPDADTVRIQRTLKFKYLNSSLSKLIKPLIKSFRYFPQLVKSIKEKEVKFFLTACDAISKIEEKNNPDLIHTHFALDQAHIAKIMASILRTPYTVTTHATDIFVPRNPLRLKRVLEDAATVFTISNFNVDYIKSLNINPKKIVVSKLGLDTKTLPKWTPSTTPPTQIICIASGLVQKKGVPVLIDAIKILSKKNIECRLTVIGSDPSGIILKKLQEGTKGLPIDFPGVLTSAETLNQLSQANIFVIPSVEADNNDKDGIPVALMEAMGLGIPSISTRVSGIPELIEHMRTGVLVAPNSPGKLAKAIYYFLSNPKTAAELGNKGREKIIIEHSLKNLAETLTEAMNSILKGN